jgi:hypothetical protein
MSARFGFSTPWRSVSHIVGVLVVLGGVFFPTAVRAEGTTCDFDGNGYEDLAVGSITVYVPSHPPSGGSSVDIFYGGPIAFSGASPKRFTEADMGGTNLPVGHLGFAVDCGDYDGDGFDDLAVSRPMLSEETPNSGRVCVMFGSASGLGTRSTHVDAPVPTRYFGMSLASGDFNADGYDDLAVGSPMQDGTGLCDGLVAFRMGVLHVYWGTEAGPSLLHSMQINRNDPWLNLTVDCSASWPTPSTAERYNAIEFGRDLVSGDFDADGTMDLAAVFYRPNLTTEKPEGGWVILYGYAGEFPPFGWGFDYDRVAQGVVEVPELVFHARIESGDFNGDGRDDLALGSGHGYMDDVSNVQIWYQEPDATMQFGPRFEDSGGFGASLAAGDFDGKGCDDMAIGAPTAVPTSSSPADAAYLYACTPGSPSPSGMEFSGGQCGATFVYSCTPESGLSDLDVMRLELGHYHANVESENWRSFPPQYYARMGWSLSAGNFFAGAEDDLIVGAIGYNTGLAPTSLMPKDGAILGYQGSPAGFGGGSGLPEYLWTSRWRGHFGWGLRSSFPCNAGNYKSGAFTCLSAGVFSPANQNL